MRTSYRLSTASNSSSTGRKRIKHNSTCHPLTSLQLVQMLLVDPTKGQGQQQRDFDSERKTQSQLIQYPCCNQSVLKSVIVEKVKGLCLMCGFMVKEQENLARLFLKDSNYTICYDCFQTHFKYLHEQNLDEETIEYYLNKLLRRCQQCNSVIGPLQSIDQCKKDDGTQLREICRKCKDIQQENKQQQQWLQEQSAVRISNKSFLNRLSDLPTENIDQSIAQSQLLQNSTFRLNNAISSTNEVTTRFDRSSYDLKEKQELINIIENQHFQIAELKKKIFLMTTKSSSKVHCIDNNNLHSTAPVFLSVENIKENDETTTNILQSKVLRFSNLTDLYSQSVNLPTIQKAFIKSKIKTNTQIEEALLTSAQSGIQSIQPKNKNNNHENNLGQKDFQQQNSKIGTQKKPALGKFDLKQESDSRGLSDIDEDFSQMEPTSTLGSLSGNERMSRSCLSKNTSSIMQEAENQPQSKASYQTLNHILKVPKIRQTEPNAQFSYTNQQNQSQELKLNQKKHSHIFPI